MDHRLASLIPQPVSVRPGRGTLQLAAPGGAWRRHRPRWRLTAAAAAAVRHLLGVAALASAGRASQQPAGTRCTVSDRRGPRPRGIPALSSLQDGITITAGDPAGAGYAAQTIRQLLPDDAWRSAPLPGAAGWELPCAEVDDRPALAWRGAHIDVARHFAPSASCWR